MLTWMKNYIGSLPTLESRGIWVREFFGMNCQSRVRKRHCMPTKNYGIFIPRKQKMVKYKFRDSKVDPEGPLRIEEIHVQWIDDGGAILDFLGEYTDDPAPGVTVIDRFNIGVHGRHECRYFVPADPENGMEDYRRYEAF
jgi:hypothetical protein